MDGNRTQVQENEISRNQKSPGKHLSFASSTARAVVSHMNTIIEAGGQFDDSISADAFKREFRRIPELKESVNKIECSTPESKYHTFRWQWASATNVCNNLERSRTHEQLLKGCDPNAIDINTAAVGNGLTDDEVKAKKERYKDVPCPRAVLRDKCRFQEAGTCFYSHAANVISTAKETPMPKAKAKAKAKDDPGRKSNTLCDHFAATGECKFGAKCISKHAEKEG